MKNPAEDHFRNEIKKGKDQGKHVVVAGCVPQGQSRADYIQVREGYKANKKNMSGAGGGGGRQNQAPSIGSNNLPLHSAVHTIFHDVYKCCISYHSTSDC